RDETARRPLGGGVVVNPFADRHRRGETDLEERLEVLRGGAPPAAARAFLELTTDFASDRATVAQALNLREEEAAAALAGVDGVLAIPEPRAPSARASSGSLPRAASRRPISASSRRRPAPSARAWSTSSPSSSRRAGSRASLPISTTRVAPPRRRRAWSRATAGRTARSRPPPSAT